MSCQNNDDAYINELQKLNNKLDSLNAKIDTISRRSVINESVNEEKDTSSSTLTLKKIKTVEQLIQTDSLKKIKKHSTKIITSTEDTLRYFYQNTKRISAIITPRINGKWKLILFNLQGEKTYEFENTISSYSSISDIKHFHSNGAISEVTCSMNPGASMYMYHSTYFFDLNNNPLKMESNQSPSNSIEDFKTYEWDITTKNWLQKFPPILNK
jgi:hypothetical protein